VTSVPWIRLYTSWPRHRKTMALRRMLGTAEPILALWCWAAENAPDGNLGRMTPDEIEFAAEWRGERSKCFDAMLAVGYVDISANGEHVLHEWTDGSGAGVAAYLRRTEKQRDLMRKVRANASGSRSGSRSEEEEEVDGHANVGANVSANRKKRAKPAVGSAAFEAFYSAYPRHVAKQAAVKAWPGDDLATKIMAALEWQAPEFSKREPDKIPHPATWLNGKRWEDEKTTNKPKPTKPSETPFFWPDATR